MSRLRLAPLILCWYSTSTLSVVTSKFLLTETGSPISLAALQFFGATLGCRCSKWLFSSGKQAPSRPTRGNPVLYLLAFCYTLGFLLTNAAFSAATASFVETFKSAEPLSTVALAALLLGERERCWAYVALAPIVAGVAMASYSPSNFSVTGMLLSLASNVSFSGRAVLTRRLKSSYPNSEAARSDLSLFGTVSALGLSLLLPLALLLDASRMLRALRSAPRLALPLLANAAAHATYNGASFAVLGRVSVASHAVLNIMRRVLVIAIACTYFGTPFSALNAAGLALAVGGLVGFARAKASSGRSSSGGAAGSNAAGGGSRTPPRGRLSSMLGLESSERVSAGQWPSLPLPL